MSPDATIEIYCDDSHERWVVAVLARGDDGFWHAKHHPGRGMGSAVQLLADDVPLTGRNIDPSKATNDPVGDKLRGRYRLPPCGLCGRTVALREDRAVPVFETLAANDIHPVSLRGLAAII
jgi:hypothetical protein